MLQSVYAKYLIHAPSTAPANSISTESDFSGDSITASPSSASVSNNISNNAYTSAPAGASTVASSSASNSASYHPLNVPGISDYIMQGASASNTANHLC